MRPASTTRPLLALLLLSAPLAAQLRVPGEPASARGELALPAPTTVLPSPDVEALLLEDEARGDWPLRYGAVLPVGLGIEDGGVWEAVGADGPLVWRAAITSPGAHTLGLVFDEYALPQGAEVYLYDPERRHVLGAYTELNNKLDGRLAVEPLRGDTVVVEYVQPRWVTEAPRLRVGEVIHDYRDLTTIDAAGGAGDCLIDVNCPEGDPYQVAKRAVFRTLAGGALCSGALLNNTAEDGTPYMLTANHCGNMTNAVFLFNYELAGCGVGGSSQSDTLSGATKLASSSTYDSQLYELSTGVPPDFHPYFAGWDRSSSPSAGPAATIGHGGGSPKIVAVDADGAAPVGAFWEVDWTAGMVIGGNSGGPLFDGALRVIGPACCVNNFECGLQSTSFGRLDQFWPGAGLGAWLDPLATGTLALDGFDPHPPTPVAPSLLSVTPSAVQPFESPTLTLAGSELHTVTSVSVGGQPVLGFGATETILQLTPPAPTTLGPVDVVVENAFGSASIPLEIVETSPPVVEGAAVSFTQVVSVFELWGGQLDLFLARSSLTPTTFPFEGFGLLLDGFKVGEGSLDDLGHYTFEILPSPVLAGASAYTQVLFVDEATMAFAGASEVVETFFLF